MHWLGLQQVEFAMRELNVIGGMAGGWLRHARVGGPGAPRQALHPFGRAV